MSPFQFSVSQSTSSFLEATTVHPHTNITINYGTIHHLLKIHIFEKIITNNNYYLLIKLIIKINFNL